jgi:hypothetical protein
MLLSFTIGDMGKSARTVGRISSSQSSPGVKGPSDKIVSKVLYEVASHTPYAPPTVTMVLCSIMWQGVLLTTDHDDGSCYKCNCLSSAVFSFSFGI